MASKSEQPGIHPFTANLPCNGHQETLPPDNVEKQKRTPVGTKVFNLPVGENGRLAAFDLPREQTTLLLLFRQSFAGTPMSSANLMEKLKDENGKAPNIFAVRHYLKHVREKLEPDYTVLNLSKHGHEGAYVIKPITEEAKITWGRLPEEVGLFSKDDIIKRYHELYNETPAPFRVSNLLRYRGSEIKFTTLTGSRHKYFVDEENLEKLVLDLRKEEEKRTREEAANLLVIERKNGEQPNRTDSIKSTEFEISNGAVERRVDMLQSKIVSHAVNAFINWRTVEKNGKKDSTANAETNHFSHFLTKNPVDLIKIHYGTERPLLELLGIDEKSQAFRHLPPEKQTELFAQQLIEFYLVGFDKKLRKMPYVKTVPTQIDASLYRTVTALHDKEADIDKIADFILKHLSIPLPEKETEPQIESGK
jgi:hypothetical protein